MTMHDDELKKLVGEIHVPEPDGNEKLSALNLAQSRFEEISRKNANSRQGNTHPARLTDVIAHYIQRLKGVLTMKKAYVITGGIAVGALALSLLSSTGIYDALIPGSSFTKIQGNLDASPSRHYAPEAEIAQEAAGGLAVMDSAAPPVPSAPPSAAYAPREAAKRAYTGGIAAGVSLQNNLIAPAADYIQPQPHYFGNDKFEDFRDNPVKAVKEEPVSTFSIDVDTASYSVVRRSLSSGHLPPKDAVRVEELINYFDYDYTVPESKAEPFQPSVTVYPTPWNPDTQLLHIGIKGHALPQDGRKPANLVFLLDTSGSMNSEDKLPLLRQGFRMLVDTLGAEDTVAIVTYAGSAGTVLEPTSASEKGKIFAALDNLRAGGGTAGGEGIRQAYALAESNFQKDGINRILLATDGDFNVGIHDPQQLQDFVERKRDTGIYLSVLGFGRGNYNDALMQKLAQNGNGNAAYIDNLNEARKVLVDEATSTLYPIAGDVKIQVEFNPAAVAEYRLIGYETRKLNREDFNNDKVDAGEIGAGHTVTAIYEITPAGSKARLVDDLRYGEPEAREALPSSGDADEIAFLKLRYKLPGEKESKLLSRAITKGDETAAPSDDVRFATAVAAFGQLLRNETFIRGSGTRGYGYDDVIALAQGAKGVDAFGYRAEFVNLVRLAKTAQAQQAQPNGIRY